MEPEVQGEFDADFEYARRAVDLGWLTREQVEGALLETERSPGSKLVSHLPLTPDQLRDLGAATPGLPPDVQRTADDPSRRVAQYVLSRHRWTGGMGEVVKAWDTRLSRWVALKFTKGIGDARQRACFEQEARLAAGLGHPNIAAIFEIGEYAGAPFIAMQFVEGRTLAAGRRAFKPREAARIVRDAARAVAFAHESGVIHRDLKPSNVMVDGAGRVYVMDFGLATQAATPGRGLSRSISGTPEYISPEQARAERADERTDVHGLGGTLYELLTGRPPNRGRTVPEVVRSLRAGDRDPPRRLNPNVEPDLEAILLKCLDREPGRRYASAAEVADDLQRYLDRDPIAARRPSVAYRLRMKFAKRKAAAAAAVAAILLAGVAGWWFLVGSPQARHLRLMTEGMKLWDEAREAAGAGGDPEGVRRRARSARHVFDRAIQEREEAEAYVMRARCLELEGEREEALETWARAHRLDSSQAEARLGLAKALVWEYFISKGYPVGVVAINETGETRGVRSLPKDTPEQQRLRESGEALLAGAEEVPSRKGLTKGLLLTGQGRYSEAAKELAQHVKEKPWDAQGLLLQGKCHFYAGQYPEALAALDRALARVENALTFVARGDVKLALRRYDDAIADFDKALGLDARCWPALTGHAFACSSKGLHDAAIGEFTRLLALTPQSAIAWNSLGMEYLMSGRYSEAIAKFTRAVEIDDKYVEAYCNRGAAKNYAGSPDLAVADFDLAIKISPRDAMSHYNRGNANGARGRLDDAIRDYENAIDCAPAYTEAWINRGRAYVAQSLHDLGISDFKRAIALSPNFAMARTNLGIALAGKGLYDEAIAEYAEAIQVDPKDVVAQNNRGALLSDVKARFAEAIPHFTASIQLNPQEPLYHFNRGEAKARTGDLDGAAQDWHMALKVAPPDWPRRALGEARIAGRGAEVAFQGAQALFGQKRYRDAIAVFQGVIDARPPLAPKWTAFATRNTACAYALLGEKANALEWLEKSERMGWNDVRDVETDVHLDSLRDEERYRSLVERLKNKSK